MYDSSKMKRQNVIKVLIPIKRFMHGKKKKKNLKNIKNKKY